MASSVSADVVEGSGRRSCAVVDPVTDALIIVDMQNDFLLSNAPLHVAGGEALIPAINQVSTSYPFRYQVATQDWHPTHHCSFQEQGGPWPSHCVQGSMGAQLHTNLHTDRILALLRKGAALKADSYSAFLDDDGTPTGLTGLLSSIGVRRIFICGVACDFCVFFTAMDARKSGFEVVVLEDLTVAIDDVTRAARLKDLENAGVIRMRSSALKMNSA